jgi:VIT1/CCC1 family predicted Fe2+/Mn2+ transporter
MAQMVQALRSGTPLDSRLVLRVVQPALLGLMDGAVSTLAPLFAAAQLTHSAASTFLVGLAGALGAGISMGLAEALSDDGAISGRGGPVMRGLITGGSTALGGMLHTLPFLVGDIRVALELASLVVAIELTAIAFIRFRFMDSPFGKTVVQVIAGGAVVFCLGMWLGRVGAGI